MFRFLKKDPVKVLEKKYATLLEEAHRLSKTDRAASDAKTAEADAVAKEIQDILENKK